MNLKQYWRDRTPFLLTNIICMVLLTLFLLLAGNNADTVILILFVWGILLTAGSLFTCRRKKKKLDALVAMAENLPERYLLAEMLPKPEQAEDEVYFYLLKLAQRSMLEHTCAIRRERQEYKEYIEQWIHEIKTPITAMKLLCENHRAPFSRELLTELEKTNRFTEQALYYARSEHTEKDYSVREIRLFDAVHQAIADNKYLLLQNQMEIITTDSNITVYSDDKWIRFILNQLIANAVKYRNPQPSLHFYTKEQNDCVHLLIEDNGIGISANDLPRIFEKGFTGQNGRNRQNATGIGLYLCRRLCDKLDIGIAARSNGHGTTVTLTFRINHFIRQVQG